MYWYVHTVRVTDFGQLICAAATHTMAAGAPSAPAHPRGYVLVDRHIEKNAGSTFRELLFQNERRGLCMYWGYQQPSTAWTKFVPLMR